MNLKKQKNNKPVAYKSVFVFLFLCLCKLCGDVTTAVCPLPPACPLSPKVTNSAPPPLVVT